MQGHLSAFSVLLAIVAGRIVAGVCRLLTGLFLWFIVVNSGLVGLSLAVTAGSLIAGSELVAIGVVVWMVLRGGLERRPALWVLCLVGAGYVVGHLMGVASSIATAGAMQAMPIDQIWWVSMGQSTGTLVGGALHLTGFLAALIVTWSRAGQAE